MDDELQSPLARHLRGWHRTAFDAILAGLLAALVLSSLRHSNPGTILAGAVILVLGATIPIVFRRRSAGLCLAILLVCQLVGAGLDIIRSPLVVIGPALVLYTVALRWQPRKSAKALGAAALATWLLALEFTGALPLSALPVGYSIFIAATCTTLLAAAWSTGVAVRLQREYLDEQRLHAAEKAIAIERVRIARELHDVVAHTMSVIAVEAGVANHLADGQSDHIHRAMSTIETTSRSAIRELRGLLTTLRPEYGDGDLEFAPAPTLDDLVGLVRQLRATGVDLELRFEGVRRQLSPGLELSAYRIVQEALTNVVKHAAATHAVVTVSFQSDRLVLGIVDDGAGPWPAGPAGHGLLGMRERVALYGGGLIAGASPGTGFRVRAWIPFGEDPR